MKSGKQPVWVAYAVLGGLAVAIVALSMRGSGGGGTTEARDLVAHGALLLDVRTPDEFRMKHLDGALNVPVDELRARLADLPPKDVKLVVYCQSGARSAAATQVLKAAGYSAYDLGAMGNW